MRLIEYITESATSPQVAAPVVMTSSAVNLISTGLPFLINIATAAYLVLLIAHKGWQMWKEYKQGKKQDE